jgi:hypothetical protein
MGFTEAPGAASSGPPDAGPVSGIVAIGASAGGLVALQEFLAHAPCHAGLAWVKPNRLGDYPMPPADAPLVAWLRDLV